MKRTTVFLAISALTGLLVATSSQAQPYGWGRRGMGPAMPPPGYLEPPGVRDPREGKIQVQSYVANTPAAGALGHGQIVFAASPAGQDVGFEQGAFETALVDQLARVGYQTGGASGATGQVMEFVVTHELVQPPEGRRNPVSGGAAIEGGSYGSGVGLGLSIDLSKPLRALIATRLEARIRDLATHAVLWEGHAEVFARDGDKHWAGPLMAQRLSAALFKNFPRPI